LCQDKLDWMGWELCIMCSSEVLSKGTEFRTRFIEKLVDVFGFSLAEARRQLGFSPSAVAKVLIRGSTKER